MDLDKITSFISRFSGTQDILKDLALLSPECLIEFGKDPEQELPKNCFNYVEEWIDGISLENLKNEYKVFSTSVVSLHDGSKFPANLHDTNIINEKTIESKSETLQTSESEIGHDETESICYKNTVTVSSILHVLTNFDLVSAFPNLLSNNLQTYKALGTVPVSSISTERSFSKVYIILIS
jgi:hypothetical protein